MTRSNESGIAMIVALFMVLILSVVGSSLMFVSQTETMSSLNYKTMTQARYAAESGVHSAANYLVFTYMAPGPANPDDSLGSYTLTAWPVTYGGSPVLLSSDSTVSANYPVDPVKAAFLSAASGWVSASIGSISYSARATLLSMHQMFDTASASYATLQTWKITGKGTVPGAASAEVEVTAVIEVQEVPLFKYAAFATDNGCEALKFGGGATTNSYDSRDYSGTGTPSTQDYGGNVGTNGNLAEIGSSTTIWGSLSTPRTGVGACSSGSVTALTTSGKPTLSGGLVELPQEVTYKSPPEIDPLPPTTSMEFKKTGGCPTGVDYCTATSDGATIEPPSAASVVTLGDVTINGGGALHLSAGIYVVNSISMTGSSSLVLDGDGPVIIKVAGQDGSGGELATPIDLTGGSVSNETYDSSKLQLIYGGTGEVKLRGGTSTAMVVYAPEATASFAGGSDFYGAIVAKKVTDFGGATIHYDRALETGGQTTGNPTMTSFTWHAN